MLNNISVHGYTVQCSCIVHTVQLLYLYCACFYKTCCTKTLPYVYCAPFFADIFN